MGCLCCFPGKYALIQIYGIYSWKKYLSGGEGNRTGQREKLKCDAIAAAFSARPKGSLSQDGPPQLSQVKAQWSDLYTFPPGATGRLQGRSVSLLFLAVIFFTNSALKMSFIFPECKNTNTQYFLPYKVHSQGVGSTADHRICLHTDQLTQEVSTQA